MKLRLLSLLVLSLGINIALAQKNFVQGYVINLGNDTINGYILDRGWDQNPNFILFKKNIEDREIKYMPHEILQFSTLNKVYQAEILKVDKSEYRPTKISSGVTTQALVIDSVFLEVIVRGTLNLYSLKDENGKLHFFVSKVDEPIQELILKRLFTTHNNKTLVANIDLYKSYLKEISKDCSSVSNKIDKVRYNQRELTNLVLEYNLCNGNGTQYLVELDKTEFRFTISAGASLTKLDFKGSSGGTIVNNVYPLSTNPTFALGMNTVFPRSRKKWSIYTEVQYRSYQTEVPFSTFNFSYIRLNAAYRYNHPQGVLRPFIHGGISYGIATKSETSLSSYRKDEQGFFGGIGLKKNRLQFESRYESTNAMSVFNAISSFTTTFYFIASYQIN